MQTNGYVGAFKARPARTGTGAQVVRMKDDESYADLVIAHFTDLTDYGGPRAMELAADYAERLNEKTGVASRET